MPRPDAAPPPDRPGPSQTDGLPPDDVLGSWKEIAQYLNRDVRTVMRWERTRGMPVHRLPGGTPKAPVHGFKRELDAWRSRDAEADPEAEVPPARPPSRRRVVLLAWTCLAVALVITLAAVLTIRQAARNSPSPQAAAVVPEALELYLRARYAYQALTPEQLGEALELYRRTVALDGRFALGWVGISATRTTQAFLGFVPAGEALPEARSAAERAIALDGRLGEPHGHLGYIALYFDRDPEKARKALEVALKLSPQSNMVRHEYADYLLIQGKVKESLEQVQLHRAGESPSWPGHTILLQHALLARRYETVLIEGRRILAVSANDETKRATLERVSRALWLTRRYQEALEGMREAYGVDGASWAKVERSYREGGPAGAMLALADWAVANNGRKRDVGAFLTALFFGAAGDADNAIRWLEESERRSEPLLLHAGADPYLDPIRRDPRFENLLKRLGITPVAP